MNDLAGMLRLAQTSLASGQHERALRLLEQALQLHPSNPNLLFARGNIHLSTGQALLAAGDYERCLKLNPRNPEAWCQLAEAHRRLGKPALTASAYQQALALSPRHAEIACNLGVVLLELGRPDEAITAFLHALRHKPGLALAKNGLGVAYTRKGRLAEALECLHAAITLQPGNADALFNLATAQQAAGKGEEAVATYRKIQNAGPLMPAVHNNMGLVLWNMRRFGEAAACHRRAIELKPDYAEAYNNLGNDLFGLQQHDEALAAFARALELRPGYSAALHNIGNVHLALTHTAQAVEAYRLASADAGLPEAVYSESLALLLQGDFAQGLPKYENRWAARMAGLQPRDFSTTRWRGENPSGKTLLLYCEQGLGDTLQFVRYAPLATALGAKVILYVQPALMVLLSGMPGVENVVSTDDPMPAHDLHCPLLSLPLAFGTLPGTIPATTPYLQAPADRTALWRERLGTRAGPRIGIVCSGSQNHPNDHNRSLPLQAFLPLAALAGVPLFLIQKEIRPEDAALLQHSPHFESLAAGIKDFADTAGIIMNLDLVISVDTSVVHLAGALGRTVWTLLPFSPDWRWLLDRNDSPWYPGMRLFRQPGPGDRAGMLAEVERELSAWLASQRHD